MTDRKDIPTLKQAEAYAAHGRSLRRSQGKVRNSDRIVALKLARGCQWCGYKACAGALEWDHKRGPKLFNLAQADKHTWEECVDEMDKCRLLCANCHREKAARLRLLAIRLSEESESVV